MTHLEIELDVEWSEKQHRAINFRAPPHPETGKQQIEIVGFLGEYGGGKTFAAAARAFAVAMANNFIPGEHSSDNPPMSGIAAPTMSDLKRGPLAQFSRALGRYEEDVVVRKVEYGKDPHWELFNGHKLLLYSAKGAKNGPTLCQFWADEIQEACWAGQWDNLQGRVRDVRSPWLNCQASGIAQRGHVEDVFRLPEPDASGFTFTRTDGVNGNRLTTLLFPEENEENLGAGYVDELQLSQPGSRQRDEDGWMLPQGAMFPSFARKVHVKIPTGVPARRRSDLYKVPTSLSVDFGRFAAVTWGQPIKVPVQVDRRGRQRRIDRGLLLVDQIMPKEKDAEELAHWIDERSPWALDRHLSYIFLDPTAEADQVRHFQKLFGRRVCRIVQVKRGYYHREDNGIRAVDRALLDGRGNVRLYVAPWLAKHESRRGVVEMFGSHLATKPKDKFFEHACDVVRYMTQFYCPLPEARPGGIVEAGVANRRGLTAGLKPEHLS